MTGMEGIEVRGGTVEGAERILTPEALRFVADLHRAFNPTRERLLQRRRERQAELDAGALPGFLASTRHIREGDWRIAPTPPDLQQRWVEITGPTDRKMLINALNSGASTYMADFEDANAPTWANMVGGQANLIDAVERTITLQTPEKTYRLNDQTAVLLVRPRGWHLPEKHLLVDGAPVAGALFDFGLFLFHCGHRLLRRGTGPYLYLPKLENHLEARLWNDVFTYAEDRLGLGRGVIKATVLIEHILAAFEMDEILYELRDHAAGLNAGRWDYIYSIIKCFGAREGFVFPDRAQVTMTVPFMRAYALLLVRTCHRRGAHALGGMAAFIPSRRDPAVNATALAKVREDKVRESTDGFDGTWVAHPDLVPVAREVFAEQLAGRPHQLDRRRDDVQIRGPELIDVAVPGGTVTDEGLRNNVSVGLQYLESWLRGVGAAAIYNLMEDVATAEIARSQVWQWVHHRRFSPAQVRTVADQELGQLRDAYGQRFDRMRFADARAVFEQVALSERFVEFLTLAAYDRLE
ncbi:MAG TPA: malate synthase A [bacterium]|nr:malate synthase A [bacterium]